MKKINFKVSQDTIEKLSEDVIISDKFFQSLRIIYKLQE